MNASKTDETQITFIVSDWYYQSLGITNINFVKLVNKTLIRLAPIGHFNDSFMMKSNY